MILKLNTSQEKRTFMLMPFQMISYGLVWAETYLFTRNAKFNCFRWCLEEPTTKVWTTTTNRLLSYK